MLKCGFGAVVDGFIIHEFLCAVLNMCLFLFESARDACVCSHSQRQRSSLNVRSTWFICRCHAGQHCSKLHRSTKLKYHLNACANLISAWLFKVSLLLIPWVMCWLFDLSPQTKSLCWGQTDRKAGLPCFFYPNTDKYIGVYSFMLWAEQGNAFYDTTVSWLL